MTYTAEIFTATFVVLGDFNPAIYTPDWFEKNNLIGEGDASIARDGRAAINPLVSHQVTNFDTDWFTIQVLENKLTLSSKGVLTPALKDLAVGIFQLLPHTPVVAMGMNFIGQFKLNDIHEQCLVGDVFAPKAIWNSLYPEDHFAGLENMTIRIQHGSREDGTDSKDEKRILIQRSANFKFGIGLSLNDHHDLIDGYEDNFSPAERVVDIVVSQWESVWAEAERIFDQILSNSLTENS